MSAIFKAIVIEYKRCIQWVKKLSQCLAVSERVVCNKSNELHKTVKILYVIV